MTQVREFLKRHALICGIALMVLFTWPVDLAHSKVIPVEVPFAIYITLGYGFIVASVLMTWLTLGGRAVVDLLKRFLIWRVDWRWYATALLIFPAIFSLAVALNALLTATPPDFSTVFAHQIFGAAASLPLYVLPFLLFDALTNGEEIGWRGFVLPRVQAKTNALTAALIVGVIWAAWHIPKFLSPGNTSPFGLFAIEMVAHSILYTWIYNNTRGSLLLVTLFHAAGNTAGVFLPGGTTVSGGNVSAFVIQIALEVIVAVIVVLVAGPERLSRSQEKQVEASAASPHPGYPAPQAAS